MSNLILLIFMLIIINFVIGAIAYNCGYKDRKDATKAEKEYSYSKGREDGYTEGYKCGFDQGREIGRKEGRSEGFADGKIYGAQQSYNEEALRAMGLEFTGDKNLKPKK